MRKFLIRLTYFTICLIAVFFITYMAVDYVWNSKTPEKTIFIWGDSQAYQGLNLVLMRKLTGKRVLSAARHGAGIYDFLVFTEKVPRNASVVIALSRPVQLRRKEKDRNWSGISPTALFALYQNNYSLYDIGRIVKKNIKPAKLYVSQTPLYPYYNRTIIKEPLSLFEKIYSKIPAYLEDKQALYKYGIQTLKNKNCNITFIEFPYHPIVEAIAERSDIRKLLDIFRDNIITLSQDPQINIIYIDTAMMYDLSHLNIYGATMVTKAIAQQIKYPQGTTLHKVKLRSFDTGAN